MTDDTDDTEYPLPTAVLQIAEPYCQPTLYYQPRQLSPKKPLPPTTNNLRPVAILRRQQSMSKSRSLPTLQYSAGGGNIARSSNMSLSGFIHRHLLQSPTIQTTKDIALLTTTQTEHQMKGRLLLNVVVAQRAAILELLAGKDQSLLVRRDTLPGMSA